MSGIVFLLIASALSPSILRIRIRLWMQPAWWISKITNPIITALKFYLLFTPAALICRWPGENLLGLKYDYAADSYCRRHRAGPPPETIRN